ncbi:MAG: hypothetical protein PUB10_01810 [Clostridiales bacterium]|nr:hypothetical protein [Clostridiales bacterium]
MKKRFLALFMVLVAVLSIVGIKQDTSCVAEAASKTYWIDVVGKEYSETPVKITIKGKKMSIKGDIYKSSTEDFSKEKYLTSIKNLKISSKCKAYITAAGTDEKYSMKSAKAALKSGDFVGVKMKIKNNIVYKIYFHV